MQSHWFLLCSKSASCTHVSALLHALLCMSESELPMFKQPVTTENEEEVLPVTLYSCKWKVPKKSTLCMSEATFEKRVWKGEEALAEVNTWRVWPMPTRAERHCRWAELIDKLHGKGLSISLSLDSKSRCWNLESNKIFLWSCLAKTSYHIPSLSCVTNTWYFYVLITSYRVGKSKWEKGVYTEKGLNIQQTYFDEAFWRELFTKLEDFYDNYLAPEIVLSMYKIFSCVMPKLFTVKTLDIKTIEWNRRKKLQSSSHSLTYLHHSHK